MRLEPHLFFDGTCEEALRFYATIFGGGIAELQRYEDSPVADDMPLEARKNVMHATFTSQSIAFVASDSNRASGCTGSRVALSLWTNDMAEGQRIFDTLSTGGVVAMPYGKMFWGAMLGMLTDRYGVDWMINCELPIAT